MSVRDSQLYSSTTVCIKCTRGAARHCSEIHYKQVQNRQVQLYSHSLTTSTVKTEIIGHHARTLELPFLVKFVSQARAERESSRAVFPPNPEGEILDVLAPCLIILVFMVQYWYGIWKLIMVKQKVPDLEHSQCGAVPYLMLSENSATCMFYRDL